MATEVKRQCGDCLGQYTLRKGFHPMISITAQYPWDHIQVDYMPMPLESKRKNKFILHVLDIASGYSILRATPDKTEETTARTLIAIFGEHGFPRKLQTDMGTEFLNKNVELIVAEVGILHKVSPPYRPQVLGAAERRHKEISISIRQACAATPEHWDERLPFTMLYQNLRISRRHKSAPFSVYFGRRHVPFADFTDALPEALPVTNDTWAQRLDQLQDTIFPALHHITKKYTGKLTKTFDRLHAHDLIHFDAGDVVMVRSEGRTTKAMKTLFGPYVIKAKVDQRYELAHRDGSAPSEFKDKPQRVELLRLVHRSTEPPLNDDLWTTTEGGVEFRHIIRHRTNDDNGQTEYLVRWREGDPTWETAEAFDDPNDIAAYHKALQTKMRKRQRAQL